MSDVLVVHALVERLTGWLRRLMPPGARREALIAVLKTELRARHSTLPAVYPAPRRSRSLRWSGAMIS
jgi:hypothetical protein